jgi:predicted nucleotide-binding protein (sugar kinase/HSP70/actin superfamily)
MRSRDVPFTRSMRSTHTILAPSMATIQFRILVNVLRDEGYKVKLLENEGPQVIQKGLSYVHNDTCYPALLVIGQMIDALDSGQYDLNKTALAITQTGGGCRASNYIHLLRKALDKAGYKNVPIISLNLKGMNRNSGFRITLNMLRKGLSALLLGDTLMLLKNQVIPYEVNRNDTNKLVDTWIDKLSDQYANGKGYKKKEMAQDLKEMVQDFAKIKVDYKRPIVKVGVVGEIYMKYAPLGNNHLEDFLATQEVEVMIPGIMGFVLYGMHNQIEDIDLYGGSKIKRFVVSKINNYLLSLEKIMIDAVNESEHFIAPKPFDHTIETGREVINLGCKMGEGWLLTAEMADLAQLGYKNIICVQPFGCLPNHIVGKGMIRKLKEVDKTINIVPIDYDPGATKVNQENRIKLMLAVANENRIKEIS